MYAASRHLRWLVALAVVSCAACGTPDSQGADSSRQPPEAEHAIATSASPSTTRAATRRWDGTYQLRGTIEGSRSVSGTLALEPLSAGTRDFAIARQRVRRTYPAYGGPVYRAQLSLAEGADTLHGVFSCAHGPATPPSLVCHPTAPLKGLADATLVAQPDGRAMLTGSHGEGVSVEYGRFTWTVAGS